MHTITRVDDLSERNRLLHSAHVLPTSGHPGVCRMNNTLKTHFYWPRMYTDIKQFVSNCLTCKKTKFVPSPPCPFVLTHTADVPFLSISIIKVGTIVCKLMTLILNTLTRMIHSRRITNNSMQVLTPHTNRANGANTPPTMLT